jgi:UDP-N-acetylmuramoylalanine--D-glutamate ligase
MRMREPAFKLLPQPAPIALAGRRVLVLGLGDTGLSVARWVESEGGKVRVADTRKAPPRADGFGGELHAGRFTKALLKGVDLLCISPGLALEQPLVREAIARGVPVAGDVELFAWALRERAGEKALAITGTNGKSTVTALTGHLMREAGLPTEVAGNIGPPALEALMRPRRERGTVWVLELSSYQLETTWSLAPEAAAMLNLSEDHLDRYAGLAEYAAAKARVFLGAKLQVLNRCDSASMAMALPERAQVTFGMDVPPMGEDFGVVTEGGRQWLARGAHRILDAAELPIFGAHNLSNALAACALAHAAGAPPERLAAGLRSFRGLPHRLERVALRNGVAWYDDSKGTNVGASIAALKGLGRKAVLIAGGDGKGQDFAPLADAVRAHARAVLLIGRDAPVIERALKAAALPASIAIERRATLEDAVASAAQIAAPGEAVLLSPACASFDMFRDYRERGEKFARAVRALGA